MTDRDTGAGTGTTLLGWVALIISIIALVLAWTAFNRSGENLEDMVRDEVQEQTQNVNEEQEQNQQDQPDAQDAQDAQDQPDAADEPDATGDNDQPVDDQNNTEQQTQPAQ